MVKVVVLIDCDECGISFYKASVSSTPQQAASELEMRFLTESADLHGWRFMHEYAICPECIKAELAMSDYLQEDEY